MRQRAVRLLEPWRIAIRRALREQLARPCMSKAERCAREGGAAEARFCRQEARRAADIERDFCAIAFARRRRRWRLSTAAGAEAGFYAGTSLMTTPPRYGLSTTIPPAQAHSSACVGAGVRTADSS